MSGAAQSLALAAGEDALIHGNTIVTLAAGDVIDMAIQSSDASSVTFGNGTSAVFTVKKLN